jgi:hypothetical protein
MTLQIHQHTTASAVAIRTPICLNYIINTTYLLNLWIIQHCGCQLPQRRSWLVLVQLHPIGQSVPLTCSIMSSPQKVVHSKARNYHCSLLLLRHEWHPFQYLPPLFEVSEPPFYYVLEARMMLVEVLLLTKCSKVDTLEMVQMSPVPLKGNHVPFFISISRVSQVVPTCINYTRFTRLFQLTPHS